MSGKIGAGKIVLEAGPVRLVAANITPDAETGIYSWNDRELARAIREGISRDGRTLIGMPTEEYSIISDEDLVSIVVYLRSIDPVHNALPKTSVPPEMQKTIQRVSLGTPVLAADLSDPVKRGAYYVKIGRCDGCHTPRDQDGNRVRGFEYGGGSLFEGSVASTNITSDASGISHYDEWIFIKTIRTGRVGGIRNLSPMMPWAYFRNMTDDDLKAIFTYLQTLKPVRHRIDNTEPPTLCKRCGQNHGSGHLN
jgi:mono/diheme cytochrome c family protein